MIPTHAPANDADTTSIKSHPKRVHAFVTHNPGWRMEE